MIRTASDVVLLVKLFDMHVLSEVILSCNNDNTFELQDQVGWLI